MFRVYKPNVVIILFPHLYLIWFYEFLTDMTRMLKVIEGLLNPTPFGCWLRNLNTILPGALFNSGTILWSNLCSATTSLGNVTHVQRFGEDLTDLRGCLLIGYPIKRLTTTRTVRVNSNTTKGGKFLH